MPLPSFFQRFLKGGVGQRPGAEPVSLSEADVEAVRVRARRRLIGMAVLVGIGVIGFPWLFETKPRPMSMDVEVVQQGASAPVRTLPRGEVRAAVESVTEAPAAGSPEQEAKQTEATAEPKASVVARADKAASKAEVKAQSKSEGKTEAKAEIKKAEAKAETKSAKPEAKAESKADAKAEAKPDSKAADKVRYIIQIGAFSDVPAAREVRLKAERAGLKTYTQVIGEGVNKKIRVRLGPFEDKAAADKAMATLRKASLSGALLTL